MERQRKNEKWVSGAREDSTDGFHLPDRRDRQKTAVDVEDPRSVSKPNGKNEREGKQGRGDIQTIDSTYPTSANTSVESVEDPRRVVSEGTWA